MTEFIVQSVPLLEFGTYIYTLVFSQGKKATKTLLLKRITREGRIIKHLRKLGTLCSSNSLIYTEMITIYLWESAFRVKEMFKNKHFFHIVKLMVNEELIAVNLKLEQYLFYLRNKTVVFCS